MRDAGIILIVDAVQASSALGRRPRGLSIAVAPIERRAGSRNEGSTRGRIAPDIHLSQLPKVDPPPCEPHAEPVSFCSFRGMSGAT